MSSESFAPKPKAGEPWDVAIIGSGPAALTAAIYTTRGAASTILIAGHSWGGQLMLTTEVDNFPGFPEGIEGPTLMQNMRKQVERFDAEIIEELAESVDFSTHPFAITTESTSLTAKTIILATGADTRWLGVPGEEKLRGRGVSSCAPCDAPFFKEKNVIVVGGGDSAMEEALVISKYAKEVTLLHRRDSFKASAAMQKRVFDNPKIKVVWNSTIVEMIGDTKLEKVLIATEGKDNWEMPIDGVFVAIGHIPATQVFAGKVSMDEIGYLVRHPKEGYDMATDIQGIFTAGDVHDRHYRQAITAAGFGAMAALDVLKFLDKDIPTW